MSTSSSRSGCCTRDRTRGPGMPTLIATGICELLAHLVDGVVLRVVDRDLRRERRDAHQAEARILGVLTDAAHVLGRRARVVHDARDEEAAGMRVGDLERLGHTDRRSRA